MRKIILVILLLFSISVLFSSCSKSKKIIEVKPDGQTLLNNINLDTTGNDNYNGYIGVKIKVGDSDLKVSMLGRIGKHVRNDHDLTIMDETKAIVATAKLTNTPDAYYKSIAYVNINSNKDVVLKANSVYYILSMENSDFWYGEKTSTSANPYFSIEGVVMSEDGYDFAFMKDTKNRVLGPVDFVFTVIPKEEN